MKKGRKSKLFIALIIVMIEVLCAMHPSYSQPIESYWQQYDKAQDLIKQKNYQKAQNILIHLLTQQENFNVYILIAETYSAQQNPTFALYYYEKAYQLSKDVGPADYNKRALFGLARAELALRNGRAAQRYYLELLKYELSPDDRKVAETNLKTSQQVLKQQQFNEEIKKIQTYIDQKDGAQAFQEIKPLLAHQLSIVYLLAGESSALLERPKDALQYYQHALLLAKAEKNITHQRIALFAIARMQLALKEVEAVKKTYRELRTMQLSLKDEQKFFTGLQQLQNLEIELTLQEIRNSLQKGEAKNANQLLKPYLNYHLPSVYLLAGDIQAALDQPKEAIEYYQRTLQYAKAENNSTYQRIAIFAIARMRLALRDEKEARRLYSQLLAMNLSEADRTTALAGLKQVDLISKQVSLDNELIAIQKLIDSGEGQKALTLLQPYLISQKTAIVYLLAAHGNALINHPDLALSYYQHAYSLAKNEQHDALARIAMFGRARMQLVLRQPKAARATYLQILHMNLPPQDRRLAQQGLNKAYELGRQIAHEQLLASIRAYISEGQGFKAYQLILPLIKTFNEPIYYILAANSLIAMDNLRDALAFYRSAYQLALLTKNIDEQREALTGVAMVQMGLDQYVRATTTYKLLLKYPLNLNDYELAKAGLVKSYAYRGRIYTAFDEIPWDIQFTSPHMVVAALQTTLWIGRGDIAKQLYLQYQSVLTEIKPGTHLYRDLKNIEWLLCLQTAPYQLKPEVYSFKDSEDFSIQRDTLSARRYWSQNLQTKLVLGYLKYAQYGDKIDGKSFLINQTWSPSRYLSTEGEIAPTTLSNHWDPFLWGISGSYTPSDFVSINGATRQELLEGFTAVSNRISLQSYRLGAVIQPLPYVTITTNRYRLDFSDDNARDGYYFNGAVTFIPIWGIYGGYRIRNYTSEFQSPFYFSPDHYNEKLYILGISEQIGQTWRAFGEGGYGKQAIKSTPDSETGTAPSWFYRFGLRGPITRCIYFDIQYGNYQQASAFVNATGYRFHDILASLTFSFD